MATDVVMPQMGESIAEGTVSKWLKKVGDKVERDEPLLEISTDKVDAEIPSPAAGTLAEIVVQEGQTVAVNSVVARIAADGDAAAQAPASGQERAAPAAQPPAASQPPPAPAAQAPPPPPAHAEQAAANAPAEQEIQQQVPAAQPPPVAPEAAAAQASPQPPRPAAAQPAPAAQPQSRTSQAGIPQPSGTPPAWAARQEESEDQEEDLDDGEKITSLDERRRTMSSPLVRKIARENNIDLSQVSGSGVSGRVTKNDILDFLQQPRAAANVGAPAESAGQQPAAPQAPRPAPSFESGQDMRIEPLSVMRKRIAQHMVESRRTSAHVTTVFEVDFSHIERLRRQHKDAYGERDVKLTYLPFIVQAVIAGLREFPILNASMDDNNVIYHRDHNIGIAVALEWGLIVPVVKHADEKNILGLARTVNDLGERARTKKLSPDEVQGGTFTITNPGIYGGLFGTPIINQPQVAILGVGGVKKRPVVVETEAGDSIAIRPMCILALSFDHRLIDGSVADQFMAHVRSILEKGPFTM